jgi:hypothetical protein
VYICIFHQEWFHQMLPKTLPKETPQTATWDDTTCHDYGRCCKYI